MTWENRFRPKCLFWPDFTLQIKQVIPGLLSQNLSKLERKQNFTENRMVKRNVSIQKPLVSSSGNPKKTTKGFRQQRQQENYKIIKREEENHH